MQNIGIIGRKRTGKDTVASFLVDRGYVRIGFADALKDAALALDPIVEVRSDLRYYHARIVRLSEIVGELGWETAKDQIPEVRRTLQHMGESIRLVLGDHSWRNAALSKAEAANAAGRPVVISDVRYPDEARHLADLGFTLVRLIRPGCVAVVGEHCSESYSDTLPADVEIRNDGTLDDLSRAASALL